MNHNHFIVEAHTLKQSEEKITFATTECILQKIHDIAHIYKKLNFNIADEISTHLDETYHKHSIELTSIKMHNGLTLTEPCTSKPVLSSEPCSTVNSESKHEISNMNYTVTLKLHNIQLSILNNKLFNQYLFTTFESISSDINNLLLEIFNAYFKMKNSTEELTHIISLNPNKELYTQHKTHKLTDIIQQHIDYAQVAKKLFSEVLNKKQMVDNLYNTCFICSEFLNIKSTHITELYDGIKVDYENVIMYVNDINKQLNECNTKLIAWS